MSESKRPNQASRDEKSVRAARDEIVGAREEIAEAREEIAEAREGLDEACDLALAVAAAGLAAGPSTPPREGGLDPVSQIIQNELNALGDKLSPFQQGVLADLLRLHLSLRGPQHLLETTGNFNRPVFPPTLSRR
jgi:hypothetical protein